MKLNISLIIEEKYLVKVGIASINSTTAFKSYLHICKYQKYRKEKGGRFVRSSDNLYQFTCKKKGSFIFTYTIFGNKSEEI